MVWRSVGLKAADETCWITSLRSTNGIRNDCCRNMPATTTKTAPISGWGRERRTVEVVPEPLVASCLMTDLAGCTTATIALPSRDKFSPIPNIHTPHWRTRLRPKEPSRSSKQFLIKCRLPVQAVAKKNRAIFGADGVLANHRVTRVGQLL
jgi:hypothetical protein